MYDVAIIGGGIVGLSTGMILSQQYPEARIVVLEKESHVAFHQTGRNSGVIHSGIYYKPGSFKAKFSRQGNHSMVEFCQRYGIDYDLCGKVIVATQEQELALLENLYQRGLANGIQVKKISAEEVKEIEPYVCCLAGVHVLNAGIVNYQQVCQKFAELIKNQQGELYFNTKVEKIVSARNTQILQTNNGVFESRFVVNCAGLQSDRVAKLGRVNPQSRIVPFRGEYYELKPEKRYLVKSLIYPVPNPAFPFLGVHFTRMINGSVHAGPNAVLSLKREGYKKTDFDLKDFLDTITYPGFWKLAKRYASAGIEEMIRSFSKATFVHSLQKLIPEIQPDDLIPAPAGVRAQALMHDGKLVDDFSILRGENAIHVCNAPSPAATSSIEIGREIVTQLSQDESFNLESLKA